MQIKLDTVITDIKGKPLMEGPAPLTVRDVIVGGLLNAPDQRELTGEVKQKRFQLAVKIEARSSDEIGLTVDQITLIKTAVASAFSTLVVGRIFALLDPVSSE